MSQDDMDMDMEEAVNFELADAFANKKILNCISLGTLLHLHEKESDWK